MTRIDYRLLLALTLSFMLHFVPLLSQLINPPPPPPKMPPLEALLRAGPPPVQAQQAPLIIPEQTAANESVTQKKPPKTKLIQQSPTPTRVRSWQDEVMRQIRKLDQRGLFYPAEAIAQGLEGEALVLLMIDPDGKVSAARIEQGSGHRILDDAALRAVRSLHSLPADAPHETLLPVRFRLR